MDNQGCGENGDKGEHGEKPYSSKRPERQLLQNNLAAIPHNVLGDASAWQCRQWKRAEA